MISTSPYTRLPNVLNIVPALTGALAGRVVTAVRNISNRVAGCLKQPLSCAGRTAGGASPYAGAIINRTNRCLLAGIKGSRKVFESAPRFMGCRKPLGSRDVVKITVLSSLLLATALGGVKAAKEIVVTCVLLPTISSLLTYVLVPHIIDRQSKELVNKVYDTKNLQLPRDRIAEATVEVNKTLTSPTQLAAVSHALPAAGLGILGLLGVLPPAAAAGLVMFFIINEATLNIIHKNQLHRQINFLRNQLDPMPA